MNIEEYILTKAKELKGVEVRIEGTRDDWSVVSLTSKERVEIKYSQEVFRLLFKDSYYDYGETAYSDSGREEVIDELIVLADRLVNGHYFEVKYTIGTKLLGSDLFAPNPFEKGSFRMGGKMGFSRRLMVTLHLCKSNRAGQINR